MVAASNIQYSWTQFVPEIRKAYGWERAAIQTAFSIFVVVQTWSTPFLGHFIDRYGPRVLVLFGGVLTGLAWVVNSYATTLTGFYVGAVVGGLGVGAVYATCVNNSLKWFPDKRGLAVGLTAAGYGSGTILTVVPIANMIATFPLPNAFNVGDGLNTGGFAWNPPSRFRGPFYMFRVDHKINDNNDIFGRFLFSDYDTFEGDFLNARPAVFPGFPPLGEVFRRSQSLAIMSI